MRSSWRIGQWRGVPISLHWTVFIGVPWFFYLTRSLAETAIAFVALFLLFLVHELGHAAVARWRRIEVDRIELFFIHGTCSTEEPHYELDDVLIAWGGVAAQFAVLVVAFLGHLLLAALSPLGHVFTSPLLRVFIETNLLIMIINLIPVAPLDGAKAWRILPMLAESWKQTAWAASLRKRSAAREMARTKKLEAKSVRIAADIIDKLKKRKSDV